MNAFTKLLILLIAVLPAAIPAAIPATMPATAAFAESKDASPEEVRARAAGDGAFALDLYARLLDDKAVKDGSGNLFFSPHSISIALAMTWAGARGETEAQMARVLHFSREAAEEHRAFAGLVRNMEPGGVGSANALWVQEGFELLPDYLDLIEKNYRGGLKELDFREAVEGARTTINEWVGDRTAGKIEELLAAGDLDSATELVLTNALHFKKAWASRFDPGRTAERPFHVTPERTVTVPMMFQKTTCGLGRGEGCRILRLPFEGGKMSLVVLLPDEAAGLAALEKGLTVEKLAAWLQKLQDDEANILLPRFKMNSRVRLEKILKEMGMSDAFSDMADFSGMTGRRGLFIDRVIHQACVEVDEDGAEAAAATAVTMKRGFSMFAADHPFLFFIRDDATGSLVFMGRVVDPTAG